MLPFEVFPKEFPATVIVVRSCTDPGAEIDSYLLFARYKSVIYFIMCPNVFDMDTH